VWRLGLGAVLVLALAGVACDKGETQEVAAAPEMAAVERRDLEIRAESSGEIEPIRVVEVKSKVSGELLRMTVETGDEVRQGALIASVDPRDVRNSLAQTEADLELARARVATTESQRRRAEQLSKAGVMSAQDLETAQLEETNARAQLLKAETNQELAREKTGDVTIRAPISGTVIEKTVEQGQIIASAAANVSGGTTLIKMADLATVQARALVDETDIGQVRPGQEALVTVEAYPNRTFHGRVQKIEPQAVVEQNVTMFPVLVRLENPERLLKPGMNAEVSIQIADRAGVLAVPNGSVVSVREAPAAGVVLGLDEQKVRDQLAALRKEREAAGGVPDGRAGRDGPGAGPDGNVRPGVVFVKTPSGPEARVVMLGLADWDHTEILRGLDDGAEVYLISVVRLQQQQQQQAQRMKERSGAGVFGGGSQRGGGSGRPGGDGQRSGGRP
jgi:HlyD family secretion protein